MTLTFPRTLWFFVCALALIKMVIAATIGLGNDEVYYWTYALQLEWNYFDHPPFVAWLIRASTLNLALNNELSVRIGAILSSSICSLLIFRMGQFLANHRVAWYSVLLYSCSFYCSIIAGTFILPDSPQMIFWLWAIYLFLKINKAICKGDDATHLWCWFGLVVGLCMLCKVHGLFLWIAIFLFATFKNPKIFTKKGIYLALLITLLLFCPVIIWNFQHHFITYSFHSERVNLIHTNLNPLSFLREISGEFFYNNPVIVLLTWIAMFGLFRKKTSLPKQEIQILLLFSLPLILTLIIVSLFRDTLPHWSGPGYACLVLLAGLKLENWQPKRSKVWISISAIFFLFILSLGMLIINFYPGTLSNEQQALHLGKGDPTLDLYGWKETAKIVDSVYHNNKKIYPLQTMVINKWFPAAHLDFYVSSHHSLRTYGVGNTFDLHQYAFTNEKKKKLLNGEDALYIIPSNLFNAEDFNQLSSHFQTYDRPLIVPIYRNGYICKNILIFRLHQFKG